MKLSIIIANYNTAQLTIDCVNSIFENQPKCSFEVILVDDASPDGSGKKLIELQKKYK